MSARLGDTRPRAGVEVIGGDVKPGAHEAPAHPATHVTETDEPHAADHARTASSSA
jgi:hypothetical protein